MEQQTIEGASTSDAVGFITVVQSLKRKLKNWEKNVEVWLFGCSDHTFLFQIDFSKWEGSLLLQGILWF